MPTQAEAEKMWCPFGRARSANGASAINRDSDGTGIAQCSCIATDCMAWRWAGSDQQPRRRHVTSTADAPWDEVNEPARPVDLPASYVWSPPSFDSAGRWTEPEEEYRARYPFERLGFCGLAG